MSDSTLCRFPAALVVLAAALLLMHCSTPETTIRSTVSSDLERPIPGVFVAVQNADRSYLNPSALMVQLVDTLQKAGLETGDVTFNPLTLDEQPGIAGAQDASLPFALVVSFKGGKVTQKTGGVPLPTSFEVDASLYDAETEGRVWRGAINAVESENTEATLADRIIGALQKDGVIPATESAERGRE